MVEHKDITVKNRPLRVYRDGRIEIPEKTTEYVCTHFGKPQTKTATFRARTLRPYVQNSGYLEVAFTHERKVYKFLVHRLVAMAFVDGYADGMTVNHIDGDKHNNAPENLEWVTKSQNTKHAWRNGLVPLKGEANPGAKLTALRAEYIRKLLDLGIDAKTIAIVAGVSDALIYKIKRGDAWKLAVIPEALPSQE